MHELLAIHSVPNMGSQRMRLILDHYAWDAVSAWADRRNWGGIPGYLEEAMGIGDDDLAVLRRRYLED